tara:strand:- start:1443 stop:1898 length:456 start_codon:yes stop_codon:yes gene_type:complete
MGQVVVRWSTLNDKRRVILSSRQHLTGEKTIGIYALYDNSGLIYIGHSSDLLVRIRNHTKKHTFAKVKLFKSLIEAKQTEEKLIRRLRPPLNKDFVKTDIETKLFTCTMEIDVWKAIKIKHAVKDIPVADIVNQALRKQLERWVLIGNEAS